MANNRMTRINDEILKEVANIIRSELKDPRLGTLTTVVKVDTTNDLKYCKIHVSVMGDEQQKKFAIEGLTNAQGYIRHMLASRINLRNTPELKFILDESLEYGIRMEKLIQEVTKEL